MKEGAARRAALLRVDVGEECAFLGQAIDGSPTSGFWRAPCKGGAFQWVQAPPGNRTSRKQSEQSWT
jgi:hypothetical protein